MKSEKQEVINYIEFKEDKNNKIPSFKLNMNKSTPQEQTFFQVLGYFPSTLVFGILRVDEIVECDNIGKLYKNDKKAFLNDELRKRAFCNMTGASMEDFNIAKR